MPTRPRWTRILLTLPRKGGLLAPPSFERHLRPDSVLPWISGRPVPSSLDSPKSAFSDLVSGAQRESPLNGAVATARCWAREGKASAPAAPAHRPHAPQLKRRPLRASRQPGWADPADQLNHEVPGEDFESVPAARSCSRARRSSCPGLGPCEGETAGLEARAPRKSRAQLRLLTGGIRPVRWVQCSSDTGCLTPLLSIGDPDSRTSMTGSATAALTQEEKPVPGLGSIMGGGRAAEPDVLPARRSSSL